jgi:hypothetical protein
MPPVNAIEVAVFAAALLVFSVLPAILNVAESWRRRPAPPQPVSPPLWPTGPEVEAPTGLETEAVSVAPAAEAVEIQAGPVAPEEKMSVVAEVPDEGTHTFRLDDLRHARALETPDREALGEPERQQSWEEGLRLAEAHAAEIGRMPLTASFQPQARAFHDMRRVGEVRELRFLLFATLWPTAAEQAAAEAVYDVAADGVTAARVVRRSTD